MNNVVQALLVTLPLALVGIGPFIAVYLGGNAYGFKTTSWKRIEDKMKGQTQMKTVIVYEPGDLLTADQAADHFGYTRDHFRNMLMISSKAADPRLMRLRIKTDATWRKAHKSRAVYVFEYSDIKAWYDARQRRRSVKAQAGKRTKAPNPIL